MKEALSILQGDSIFLWNTPLSQVSGMPSSWDTLVNSGLGQSSLSTLWITTYLHLTTLLSGIGWTWNEILVICWLLPTIAVGFYSASLLFSELFPALRHYRYLSGFFYLGNTYFLLVFFGGQMGVSLAYSLVPLVIFNWVKLFRYPGMFYSLLTGLVMSIQFLFDPRIILLSLLIVCGMYLVCYSSKKYYSFRYALFFFLPFSVLLLLHAFWIVPLVLFSQASQAEYIISSESFRFFSFADFPHAISLLHPNWPENIFGKVSFMRPEFILVPIAAYASLLFINPTGKTQKGKVQLKKQNKIILFFALIGLVGAFLAKGVNEPFGFINLWFFEHIPGMTLFRDPTKWYILIALSYSILLPFSIISLFFILKNHLRTNISRVSYWLILLGSYSLLLVSPFLFFTTKPLLTIHEIPKEYHSLQKFISEQDKFSRALWIPKRHRYAYFSQQHPALNASELFGQASGDVLLKQLQKADPTVLRELSIRYIIVPFDSEEELFLDDRIYSEKNYRKFVDSLEKVSWLNRSEQFGELLVYEINNAKDHFWFAGGKGNVRYQQQSQTNYSVNVSGVKEGNILIFSDRFDPGWVAIGESKIMDQELRIQSEEYHGKLNSFRLPENGNYTLSIIYEPQIWVERGVLVSLSTIGIIAVILTFLRKGKKKL